jgi:ribulose-5-phosphate 4-epimerase/fuculose-1-phosphate aldolase
MEAPPRPVSIHDTGDPNQPRSPQPPVFATVAEERLHRKQRLAAAFRLFARWGFDGGVAGHITARDPELPDHFWVNPLAMHFGMIRVSDLLLVNHRGKVVEGKHPVNAAAFAIHSRLHAARPDVVAAAHSHSTYGKVWSAFGKTLPPISQDACRFYEDLAVYDDFQGVVLDLHEGDALANALGDRKGIVLKNHGILTVGHTVDEAAYWYVALENSCRDQLIAQAAGVPSTISHEMASLTQRQVGSHYSGWHGFQPYYEKIVHDEPDLFD